MSDMVDNTQKGVIAIAVLLGLGFVVELDATHYCEDRAMTYHCDSLSRYYGLDNGKCINDLKPNKLCSSGWIGIDRTPEESPIVVVPGRKYLCSPPPESECKVIDE